MKAYPESSGQAGMRLALLCRDIAHETGKTIAIAPQHTDLALFAHSLGIPVFAQHSDNVKQGAATGRITPEAVRDAGCTGTLINHSEFRIPSSDVEAMVSRCRALGLITIVCTKDAAESQAYAAFGPDFIAVEPPELIGGEVSVTTASPDVVADSVRLVKKANPSVKVLCGAGVKTGKDVAKAIELGADGVLLASGVVKAMDQRAALQDLASGL